MKAIERHDCRLCGGHVRTRLALNPTPIANSFPDEPNFGELYQLELKECSDCGHVQIGHMVPDDVLYGQSYKYQTPEAQIPELRKNAAALKSRYPSARTVLEIGANNGLFMEALTEHFPSVSGIDPSGTRDFIKKAPFTMNEAFNLPLVDLIVANNVLAHIDDLHDVFRGIDRILKDDGALVFEVQYFMDMAENGLFDMIYHEHRDYHTIMPLIRFLSAYGLGISHVEHLSNHGGSIRVHCRRGVRAKMMEPTVDWDGFKDKMAEAMHYCMAEVSATKEQIIAFGATAKACTLIHQLGIADRIAYCVDSTPAKQGKYIAGTIIKILPESVLTESKSPKVLFLTAWNYESIIRAKYPDFDFIVPFKPKQKQQLAA